MAIRFGISRIPITEEYATVSMVPPLSNRMDHIYGITSNDFIAVTDLLFTDQNIPNHGIFMADVTVLMALQLLKQLMM
jgi:hypothetical protein